MTTANQHTISHHVHGLGGKSYQWLIHDEQCPRLGAEVDAMETGKRQVVTMHRHTAADQRAFLGQGKGQHREVASTDVFEDVLPVPVVPDHRDP